MASLLIHSEYVRRTTEIQQKRRSKVTHSNHRNHPAHHNWRYYGICYVAGGLSSGIRWVLAPLELIKMRMQVGSSSQGEGACPGMLGTARAVVRRDGALGLFRGLAPTAVAYWFQTSTKYGLYEILKDEYAHLASEATGQTFEQVHRQYQGLIYVAAAGTAEACADVLMCPAEMVKVHVQTAPLENSGSRQLSTGAALRTLLQHRQRYRFPFGALGPLWARQVPGTVANFYVFENAASAIYHYGLQRPKHEFTAAQQLGVTVCAGYAAGICATVISHPADTLVSLMPRYPGQSLWQIARRVGWYNLTTRGLAPRIVVTAKVIGFQWLLYDSFKSLFGLGTTGGED